MPSEVFMSSEIKSSLKGAWLKPMSLDRLDDEWDNAPFSSGIYVVRRTEPVARLGGMDKQGTLYVGKARNLRERLRQMWYADHGASWYLWRQPPLAAIVLSAPIRTVTDVELHLGKLTAVVATPLADELLARAERAVLNAYITRFGEAPPLNFSLPQRWSEPVAPEDLRWAENGFL